jgi:hypothetical protein
LVLLMQHLVDITDVRAACAGEDVDSGAASLSLGLLRTIVAERDSIESRLNALRNAVLQHEVSANSIKIFADGLCERSKR